jgi:RNA binding exosome subunit
MEEVEDRSDKAGSLYLRLDKQGALKGVRALVDIDPIRMRFRFRIPHKTDPVVVISASITSIIDDKLDTLTPIRSRMLER